MIRPNVKKAALLLAAIAIAVGAAGAPKAKSIRWLTSFDRGRTQAKQAKRIMLVSFYTEW